VQYVWRFLRAQKIDFAACRSWCESNDPAFAAKAAEIVGLYLDPPDGALVLAVDEKPAAPENDSPGCRAVRESAGSAHFYPHVIPPMGPVAGPGQQHITVAAERSLLG
jgi:hypothetical protein